MGSALRLVFAVIAIVLVAGITSSAVAVFKAHAQSVPVIQFTDTSGNPISEVGLLQLDDTETVQLRVSGLLSEDINTAIVGILHDPAVIEINHACTGLLATGERRDGSPIPAFSRTNFVPGGGGDDPYSWFFCGISRTSIGASEGLIMNLTLNRKSAGEPLLQFVTAGPHATKMYEPGAEYGFTNYIPLGVLETVPEPTPQPTATTPSGGGGGGVVIPPTSTPASPALQTPGIPRNVTVIPIVEGMVVRWDEPLTNGGSPITNYRVLTSPTGQTSFVPAPATEAVVLDLDSDEEYQFQVNAINVVGAGDNAPLTFPAKPLRPLSEPRNVAASLGADGVSALVTWEPPEFPGQGPVTSYVVTAEPSTGSGMEVSPNERSVIVPDLERATIHRFFVRARNDEVLGPLSEPSNEILTAFFVGSPGEAIGDSIRTSVEASMDELNRFGQAASNAFGMDIAINGPALPIARSGRGLLVEFPVESLSSFNSQAGSLQATVGKLTINMVNGTGIASIAIDDFTTVTGDLRLGSGAGSLQVFIDNPKLRFAPSAPASFSGGGGLVTHAAAEFNLRLVDLPEQLLLSALYYEDVRQVPGGFAAFQLAAVGSGGVVESPEDDIAFVVVVSKRDITNDDLGDNTATLAASREWYDLQREAGKIIFITKVGDDGLIHTGPASCEVMEEVVRCIAVFSGPAGGFSMFGMAAVEVDESLVATPTPMPDETALPEPETTPLPTSTPMPTSAPAPTATATPAAAPTPTTQPAPTPTDTAVPLVQPTVNIETTEPDLSEPADGGFPWAPVVISLGVLAILAPAAGAAYRLYRKQNIQG